MPTPHSPADLLLGCALTLEGRTTLRSLVRHLVPTVPSQDATVAASRHFWLVSPDSTVVLEPLQSDGRPRSLEALRTPVPLLQHPSAEGGPELLTPSPGTQLPGTGTRLPELLTEEARRGLAQGLSSERGFIHFPTDTFTFAYSTRTGKKNKS